MNTKKLISMILCLALCFGVLADDCGSKTETLLLIPAPPTKQNPQRSLSSLWDTSSPPHNMRQSLFSNWQKILKQLQMAASS